MRRWFESDKRYRAEYGWYLMASDLKKTTLIYLQWKALQKNYEFPYCSDFQEYEAICFGDR